ncbi:Hsp70 family protein [Streptomyces sp. DSM 44915]|uniref:Hsp70 family protein n=1 Tax=Streptomyces chisholmiae TaxID=3075540 RepID=A0ABU2JRA0_9ACTN|nr:Hsp70 family protein [Streptomyces sp. DSM 44915]MDT0267512.1 Hsp70 family protein [Streptomyces sp. DSM 44915]
MYAIDLGGSCARVAWLDERREPVVAGAPAGIGAPDGAVPAAVWARPGGEFRIGRAAWERALTHPAEVALAVRAPLLDPAAEAAGAVDDGLGGPVRPPAELAGRLLAGLVHMADQARGREPAPPDSPITLSLPSSGDGERALRRAAESVGLRVAHALAEPVAAALHYGAIRDGARGSVLVFDQGGSSLDLTLLTTEGDRTVRIAHTVSHPLGGAAWDAAVADALRPQLARLDPEPAASPALLRAAEALRLDLAHSGGDLAQVTLPGTDHPLTLTREQLDRAVAPLWERACAAAVEVRDRADTLLETPPSTLLLAGGLAATPGTAARLEDRLGWYARAEAPELAVVRGLARRADFGLLRVVTGARALDPEPGFATSGSACPEEPSEPPAAPAPGPAPDIPPAPAPPSEPGPSDEDPHQAGGPHPPPDSVTAPGPGSPTAPSPPAAPAPSPEPETQAAPSPDPAAVADPAGDRDGLVPTPVTELEAIRRGQHLLVVWVWPPGSLLARVRWRLTDGGPLGRPGTGEATCSRRAYEHDGGFELDTGYGEVSLTVEALAPGGPGDTFDRPAALLVPAHAPVVHYLPSLRHTLRGRVARLSLTAEVPCQLPPLLVVHGTGRFRPSNPGEGRVVYEIPPQRLGPEQPVVVEFPLSPARGDNWLVCFPAGPTTGGIVLPSSARHRL